MPTTGDLSPMSAPALAEALAAGQSEFSNLDFSNQNLTGMTWPQGLRFTSCSFNNATISGEIEGGSWTDCDLDNLHGAGFSLVGGVLDGCSMVGAQLGTVRDGTWTSTTGPVTIASLSGTTWTRCTVENAQIQAASAVRFEASTVNGLVCPALSGGVFTACGVHGAQITVASGFVSFTDTLLDAGTLDVNGAGVTVELLRCSMKDLSLVSDGSALLSVNQCNAVGLRASNQTLLGTFQSTDFSQGDWSGTSLKGEGSGDGTVRTVMGCNFTNTNLSNAHLAAGFAGCSFRGADLSGSDATVAGSSLTPFFDGCTFLYTNLSGSDLPTTATFTGSIAPNLTLSSPSTTVGGVVTGRAGACGDPRALSAVLRVRYEGQSAWSTVATLQPSADGGFLGRVPEPPSGSTVAEVAAVLVESGTTVQGPDLPPVSPGGRGVLAVASASPIPAERAALVLGASRPYAPCPDLGTIATVGAWVSLDDPEDQARQPVAVLRVEGAGGTRLLVVAQTDGSLWLSLGTGAETDATLQTGTTGLRDGSWHHVAVVRDGADLQLVLDGLALEATAAGDLATAPLGGGSARLCLGWADGAALPDGTSVADLTGAIDELMVFGTALAAYEIRHQMYQAPSPADDLLGWWSFNQETGAADYPEGAGSVVAQSPSEHPLAFTGDTLPFTPADQPYLLVQQQLLITVGADPSDSAQTPEQFPTFQVVIWARSGGDLPQWLTLEVALAELPPGLTGVTVWRGATQYTLTTEPTSFALNTAGSLSLVLPALDNALLAPLLRVRAPFMDDDEWLFITPDRHLHWTLARLTPAQATTTWGLSEESAAAFAPAIAALAQGCFEHDIASNHPILRQDDEGDTREASPPTRMYENPQLTRAAYDHSTNVSASQVITGSSDVTRIGQLEDLDVPHFSLSQVDDAWTFTALSAGESEQLLATLPGGDALATGDLSADQLAALCAAVETADQVVVTRQSLTHARSGAQLSTLLVVVREGEGTTSASLTTVPEIIGLVEALCERAKVVGAAEVPPPTEEQGAEVVAVKPRRRVPVMRPNGIVMLSSDMSSALSLLWDLGTTFDWDAVRATYQVCWSLIDQGVDWMQSQIDQGLDWMAAQVRNLADWLTANLEDLRTKAGTNSVKKMRKGTSNADPLPIDASQIQRTVADNATDITMTTSRPPSMAAPTANLGLGAAASALTAACARFGTVDTLLSMAVPTLLSICETLIDAVTSAVVGGIALVRDAIDTVFAMLDDLLDTHIQIPVITWLFEEWLMDDENHHKLKGKSLLAFLVALPVTLAQTLATGKAPFGTNSTGHKVTDAVAAIPGWLAARSLSTLLGSIPALNGAVSLAALASAPAPAAVELDSTQGWTIFGSVATCLTGLGVGLGGLFAAIPGSVCQVLALVCNSAAALFGAPMWGIALTGTTLQWVSFGLDVGQWSVSSALPVVMDWLMLIPNIATWALNGILGLVPVSGMLARFFRGLFDEISSGAKLVVEYLTLILALPKAGLGIVGLGLGLAADIVLLVDNQLPSTGLKLPSDVLYNLGLIIPGAVLLIESVATSGESLGEPGVMLETMNAPAAVSFLLAGVGYVSRGICIGTGV